jgi:DNA repair protein RecO (recombination protein O)
VTENATGLILRTRPLTETSLIVEWLTADFGRLSTVAKGARRPKSPFQGKLDLFYAAEFSFTRARRSDLHTLREVALRNTHAPLRHDLKYIQQAAYCAHLVEQATETETPLPGVFELMQSLLAALPASPPRPRTIFAFELKLLTELGLFPNLAEANLSASAQRLVSALAEAEWTELAALAPGSAEIKELGRFLPGFLVYHLGRIPASRSAAAA